MGPFCITTDIYWECYDYPSNSYLVQGPTLAPIYSAEWIAFIWELFVLTFPSLGKVMTFSENYCIYSEHRGIKYLYLYM